MYQEPTVRDYRSPSSRLPRAACSGPAPCVSFNDRLCFVVCDEQSWTCVTNDRALRRLCERHGIRTRFGLRLVVDLVASGAITAERAISIAFKMHESNPLHINERVIARFTNALDRL